MTLAERLDPVQLRRLAGPAYERGLAIARTGLVDGWDLVHERELYGIVHGTRAYQVHVYTEDGTLNADCTCPVEDPWCKHAVALALVFLESEDQPPRREEPPADDAFAQRRELVAWAEAHHVGHELAVSADVIVERLPTPYISHLRWTLKRLSLGDVGTRGGASRHIGVRSLHVQVPQLVKQHLEHAIEDVRAGIAAEQAARAAPDEPVLATLWQQLHALRAEVRRRAHPRGPDTLARGVLDLDAATPALVWKDPHCLAPSDGTFTARPVTTRLTSHPVLALSCACDQAACTHGLALIDATLALLADPAQRPVARKLAEELARPPWERVLTALDEVRPRAEIEVWWELDPESYDGPRLDAIVKKRLKSGAFSAGTRVQGHRMLAEHGPVLRGVDLEIAEHLDGFDLGRKQASFPRRAFLAAVGHPRVVLAGDRETRVEIVRAELGFTVSAAGSQLRLEPWVAGERFSPRLLAPLLQTFRPHEPLFVFEPERDRCLLIEVGDDARRLWTLLERHGDTFPAESHGPLLERLAALESRVPLDVPEAIMGDLLTEPPVVVLRVRLQPDATLELEPFVRPAAGAPLFPPGAGPREVLVVREGERGYVKRDLDEEPVRVAGLLARLPLETAEEGPPGCHRVRDTDAALALVAALQHLPDGMEAQWIDPPPRIGSAQVSDLKLRVRERRDWFGVDGDLRLGSERLALAVVLDAARQQQRYVRVGADQWVELSEALREKLARLAEQTFAARDRLELSPGAVPALRALADAGAQVEEAPGWTALAERMTAAARLRPRPPKTLDATLRPYQVEGHAWLTRLAAWGAGGVLADDMGLGKTVQAISLLLDRAKLGPALVIAPTSVTFNWVDELRRFAPSLRPIRYGEHADREGALAKLGKRDVVIASYGLLVRDVERLTRQRFATLVLDEAQALKNQTTQRVKAARALAADVRIALTGTPLENSVGELWSVFSCVFPHLLGSWEQFRDRFALPIERGIDPRARDELARVIRPFVLRRTKAEVARELPARTEIHVPVVLSTDEAALYEDARLAAVAHLTKQKDVRDERRRFQVLAALTRLRLLASHPRLYDPTLTVPSSKLERFLELVTELRAEGHRALVFSQFTSHLALVRERLDAAGVTALYLDGATPGKQRKALIERFQAGEGDVFLISLKAGGTGINLTAADYVIHLDPWWNPAVEDQATDRAHRIGQTRPVTVYRLVSRGTVEEKILALHAHKRALVAGVLEGTDAAGRLGVQELMALLDRAT